MATESYTQCRMERTKGSGKQIHTAFIPTSLAKVGRHLEIQMNPEVDESWETGWIVVERGGTMDRDAVDKQRGAQAAFARKLDSKKKM